MAKTKIVWTETAARQRREILRYWTNRNKSTAYAEKLIHLIKERIRVISKYPHSGKNVDFPDTRISVMGHFSIFYKVQKEQIIVTAFWDNRNDPVELLNTLKQSNIESVQ